MAHSAKFTTLPAATARQLSLCRKEGRTGFVTSGETFRVFFNPKGLGHDARGYTLHEHLDAFGLINMNGRAYNPVVARFLSPDPFIQAPGD